MLDTIAYLALLLSSPCQVLKQLFIVFCSTDGVMTNVMQ